MYGGLSYGGAHRQAIRLACALDKRQWAVTYYWCYPGETPGSPLIHPPLNLDNIQLLRQHGVDVIQFHVEIRDLTTVHHSWVGTDFWEKFNRETTDLVFAVKGGMPEYPFVLMDLPIVEWNIWGSVDTAYNTVYSVAQSDWVRNRWLENGGGRRPSDVVYPFVPFPTPDEDDLRHDLRIPPDCVVVGFHQRVDDFIYGEQAFRAYAALPPQVRVNTRMLVLGGSPRYGRLDEELGTQAIFVNETNDYAYVSRFLKTLDIYTHSGGIGETLGIAIQEAMIHGVPVITQKISGCPSGNIDVAGGAGVVVEDVDSYASALKSLVQDADLRAAIAVAVEADALARFSEQRCVDAMQSILREVFSSTSDIEVQAGWLDRMLAGTTRRSLTYLLAFPLWRLHRKLLTSRWGQRRHQARIAPSS